MEPASLCDNILERFKVELHDTGSRLVEEDLDAKVAEVYAKVGLVLSRYKSGKIPKALKVLPSIKAWQKILLLTNPDAWTPNATYQVVKIFVSNLPPVLVEVYASKLMYVLCSFLQEFVLPKIRSEFSDSKHINPHHYQSLKKALYKPASFFKGVVMPLCEDPLTTLREASIISSVISKSSIPSIYSAAALAKLATLEYNGARAIFMRTILDKKYALPLMLLETLIAYFAKPLRHGEGMPVLWQQCLLVFVQRYKNDFTDEQKASIRKIAAAKRHPSITHEIMQELAPQQGGCMETE